MAKQRYERDQLLLPQVASNVLLTSGLCIVELTLESPGGYELVPLDLYSSSPTTCS